MDIILEVEDVVSIITEYLESEGYNLIANEKGEEVVFETTEHNFRTIVELPKRFYR